MMMDTRRVCFDESVVIVVGSSAECWSVSPIFFQELMKKEAKSRDCRR